MTHKAHRQRLIEILQSAYSGELAAGLAYRGHWNSVTDPGQRTAIRKIEQEEWFHRRRVGEMLTSLSARPLKRREVRLWIIGRSIGLACHLIGWFFPMYFAGRLESGNVLEYEDAASHAAALGLRDFESDLLVMARVEKEHEMFFLNVIARHRLLPLMQPLFKWPGSVVIEEPEPASQPTESI